MGSTVEHATCHTVTAYLDRWVEECPERTWLKDRHGDEFATWSWRAARDELQAVAAWLESEYGDGGRRFAILSRNRAHWMLADMAIIASGNVTVPIFTTQSVETTGYILDFADVDVLFLGESENWGKIRSILPNRLQLVALPGVDPGEEHLRWEDLHRENQGRQAAHGCERGELLSLVFTSGTTGVPKGVMQTHDSMLIPMERGRRAFNMRHHPRFLSYLPLSHLAERQLVWIQSLIHCGEVTFNESLPHLVRDMADTKPTFFFGAPRVWEQLQQGILAQFGSQEALERALEEDGPGVGERVRALLGFQDPDYLLTAAAPTPAALIHWYERLGIEITEGYGQTEAMALIANSPQDRRVGSIGKPVEGVDVKIAESDELLCRAEGLSPGYYNMPEKTAETFVDGWVHTGDKARVDEDGYYYITGRVKDYFKTIQGKFVAPVPIESEFAKNQWVEQQCLLGRGYSKTVMVCVLSGLAREQDRGRVEEDLLAQVGEVNRAVEKHARVGGVIVSSEPWSIENAVLTPTLKIRRDQVEERFGERAQKLAHDAAVEGKLLVEWVD
ncbi:MAG: AMP-binding protein [Myxococcota bacterium]|nr:AMP-binding protein [Myxococcota bacterium]